MVTPVLNIKTLENSKSEDPAVSVCTGVRHDLLYWVTIHPSLISLVYIK